MNITQHRRQDHTWELSRWSLSSSHHGIHAALAGTTRQCNTVTWHVIASKDLGRMVLILLWHSSSTAANSADQRACSPQQLSLRLGRAANNKSTPRSPWHPGIQPTWQQQGLANFLLLCQQGQSRNRSAARRQTVSQSAHSRSDAMSSWNRISLSKWVSTV